MSLNWREIDAVLAEIDLPGSFVQEAIQPDFRNIFLEIFRPGNRFYFRICLDTGKTRIHSTRRKPRKPSKRQRFAQMLHARIKGAHVTAATQVNSDRVVRIDVERAGERTILWIRLWGGAANCIATTEDGAILDAFFRRPKRGETTGEHFFIAETNPDPEADPEHAAFAVRFEPPVNEAIEATYDKADRAEERERLMKHARAALEARIRTAKRRLAGTRHAAAGDDEADRAQVLGDLITANLYRIERGADRVELDDYTAGGKRTLITLDPRLSPQENARAYYEKAQKIRRTKQNLADEQSVAESHLRQAEALLEELPALDVSELSELARATGQGQGAKASNDVPGLTLQSSGFTILVGRNARENDELLRRHVRGNDLWLHTRDYPGGYVFVRNRPGKSVPLEVLLDAGNLAIHYSKAKANGRADLFYTQVKHLRRAKDGPRGLVLPTQEKNLHVVLEPERTQRLLGREEI